MCVCDSTMMNIDYSVCHQNDFDTPNCLFAPPGADALINNICKSNIVRGQTTLYSPVGDKVSMLHAQSHVLRLTLFNALQ